MGGFLAMTTAVLLKYEASGNDFLIALDGSFAPDPGGALVRRICHRRRGVGADGLIIAETSSSGQPVRMNLFNADGSRAETSGNGLRCLALALVDAGVVSTRSLEIATDAGQVTATVGPRAAGSETEVGALLGAVRVGRATQELPEVVAGLEAFEVDVGNPHLVLVGEAARRLDAVAVGALLERAVSGRQNVEFVSQEGPGELSLTVWERGAGLTDACGSGSVAAAASARFARLVQDDVAVANPGGVLRVSLSGPPESPAAVLSGPVDRIARVEVEIESGGSV